MDFSLLINTAPSAKSAPPASNASHASGFSEQLAAVSQTSRSGTTEGTPGSPVVAPSATSRDNGAVNEALDQEHGADEGGVPAEALLIPVAISGSTLNVAPIQTAAGRLRTELATTPASNTAMAGSTAASDSLAVARERLQLMADASARIPGTDTLPTQDPATSNASPKHLLLDPEQLAQHLQRREQLQSQVHPATAPQTTAGSPSNTPPPPVATNSPVLTTQSMPTQSLTTQDIALNDRTSHQLLNGTGDSGGDLFSTSLTQANGAPRASAMTGSIPANIAAHINSPEWPQQLGHTLTRIGISTQAQDGDQRIELRLHPAELGPLSVSLRMGEHGAQAQFVSAHPHVRQAVEQALPQLREILAEQGIQLGQTSVSDHGQGTQGETGHDQSPGNGLAAGSAPSNITDNSEPLITTNTTTVVMDGRVDLYA